jgi:hypothetical protein
MNLFVGQRTSASCIFSIEGGQAMPRLIIGITVLLMMGAHAQASILYRAGPNEGTLPQTWTDFIGTPNVSYTEFFYQAHQGGLRAEVTVRNDVWAPHPPPVAEIVIDDVVVNSASGNVPPGTTTTIFFGGELTGGLTGTQGGASAILNLRAAGAVRSYAYNVDEFPVSGFHHVGPVTVTIGQPFRVSASLRVGVSALPGFSTIDFGDSFKFNRSSVLMLEPGFTASSASWGLVDNALPVPEPSGLILIGTAAIWRLVGRQVSSRSSIDRR